MEAVRNQEALGKVELYVFLLALGCRLGLGLNFRELALSGYFERKGADLPLQIYRSASLLAVITLDDHDGVALHLRFIIIESHLL